MQFQFYIPGEGLDKSVTFQSMNNDEHLDTTVVLVRLEREMPKTAVKRWDA